MSKAKSLLTVFVVLLALPMLAFGQKTSKVPTIIALSPNTTTAGAGSLTITVTGSNFTSGTTVKWNGTSLTTTYISSNQLQAAVLGTMDASAGTAKVTASTSGRFGGTSNSLSFTIAAPATTTTTTTTTTTSTSPLSITTTSVPPATAGTAVNSSFAGTGGTPAYTWSLASGSTPPPGLILGSTGSLTGTPSTAGTYSFTVQAADSSSTKQTAQKVFSMSVAASTSTTTSSTGILFSDGFESGDFSKWDYATVGNNPASIATSPSPVHSGNYSLKIHYGASGEGMVEKAFNSSNGFPNGLPSHFFIKGNVYLPSREPDATETVTTQRKLIYMFFPTDPQGYYGYIIVSAWEDTTALDSPSQITMTTYYPQTCGTYQYIYMWSWASNVTRNAWHTLELEVQLNTPGNSDGYLTLWVDGVQTHTATGVSLVGTCTYGIQRVRVGEQFEPGAGIADEYRYWDNISISTTGP